MGRRFSVPVLLISLLFVIGDLQAMTAGQQSSLDQVLERASGWLADAQKQWGVMLCDERYVQEVWGPRKVDAGPVETARLARRLLISEFLFVWVPDADRWTGFRDVAQVDGRPVRDRADRIQSLLMNKSELSLASLRALADESARFNIGPADRNLNEPSKALLVLVPRYLSRFRFRKLGEDHIGEVGVWHIGYTEVRRPTLIQKLKQDAPIWGELWVEPQHGCVMRTRLRVEDPTTGAEARILVEYARVKEPDVWMPLKMTESYEAGSSSVKGVAEYSNFRRFETSGRVVK
jgi:hypothetical protein